VAPADQPVFDQQEAPRFFTHDEVLLYNRNIGSELLVVEKARLRLAASASADVREGERALPARMSDNGSAEAAGHLPVLAGKGKELGSVGYIGWWSIIDKLSCLFSGNE
jgi:hypothetical protein